MRNRIFVLHIPRDYWEKCKFRRGFVCYYVKSGGKLVCPNPECPGRDDKWKEGKEEK